MPAFLALREFMNRSSLRLDMNPISVNTAGMRVLRNTGEVGRFHASAFPSCFHIFLFDESGHSFTASSASRRVNERFCTFCPSPAELEWMEMNKSAR